jgi:hypothetical protein
MTTVLARLLAVVSALAVAGVLSAAEPPKKDGLPPPPIPKEKPRAPAQAADDELEPEVTITSKGGDRHEEYRLHGRLYMVKVIPKRGAPYYLLYDEQGQARKSDIEADVVPPSWVIKRF